MRAKIAFDFYHDGINPTHYKPGDELPEDVAVPEEWVEASEPVENKPGDELPEDRSKRGKR